jgi:hypothetical protein
MRRIALLAVIMGFFLPVLASAPAHAQASRTWVSGVGDDANPCSRTAPCKTFAGAISKTAASGEINCLDPGGFGAVTITKAMTISCEAGTAGIVVAGTNGINVSAGAGDNVYLKGLDIEGLGTGLVGIKFNSGANLVVDNCVIRGFAAGSAWGIQHAPSTVGSLSVINSVIEHNGNASAGGGIQVSATATGFARAMLTRVVVDKNFVGVNALGTGTTSSIQIFESTITHNNSFGVSATGTGGSAKIGNSAIIGNGAAATNGNVTSYLNNEILDNATDTTPATTGGLH